MNRAAGWWLKHGRWAKMRIMWPVVVAVVGGLITGLLLLAIGPRPKGREAGEPTPGRPEGESAPAAQFLSVSWAEPEMSEIEVTWGNPVDTADLYLWVKDGYRLYKLRPVHGPGGPERFAVGFGMKEVAIARLAPEVIVEDSGIEQGHSGLTEIASVPIPGRE